MLGLQNRRTDNGLFFLSFEIFHVQIYYKHRDEQCEREKKILLLPRRKEIDLIVHPFSAGEK